MNKHLKLSEIPAGKKFGYAQWPDSMVFIKPVRDSWDSEDPKIICINDGAECQFMDNDKFELVDETEEPEIVEFSTLRGGDKFRCMGLTLIKLLRPHTKGNAICIAARPEHGRYVGVFYSVEDSSPVRRIR